jgi:hypothetical protein
MSRRVHQTFITPEEDEEVAINVVIGIFLFISLAVLLVAFGPVIPTTYADNGQAISTAQEVEDSR